MKQLKALKEDMSIAEFLHRYFSEEKYTSLRNSLKSYIEGYYSGETNRMSAKAFFEELMSEDEQQYRPREGYGKLIDHLAESCRKAGTVIQLSAIVKEIKWSKGHVEVIDDKNNSFIASKAIITVPLGVWLAPQNSIGAILFSPALQSKTEAAKEMGFGAAIKILLEFTDIFWEDEVVKNKIKIDTGNLQMALSDMPIPTWWTPFPQKIPLLTGWLSGPKADQMKNEDDEYFLSKALNSLSLIFKTENNILKEKLKWWKVFNWAKDPFTLGSYSYSAITTSDARRILSEPVQDTLFFAGEALYEGSEMGTVEAALTSGLNAASKILLA